MEGAPKVSKALDLSYKIYFPSIQEMRSTFGRLNAYQALVISMTDERFAPVDVCSSEPNCVPDCGAEVALAGEITASEDLRLLRTFRDQVLAHSSIGQRWIALYESHRLEIASILVTDNQFRGQVRLALEQWLPLVQALANLDSAQQAILTPEHIAAAEGVIAGTVLSYCPAPLIHCS